MNVSAHPVLHLPVPILELICNDLVADVQRLGRILAAWPAPSLLGEIISATEPTILPPPAVRRAQILAKRDKAVQAAWQKFAEATLPRPTLSPADSFQGFNSITVARIEAARLLDCGNTPSAVARFQDAKRTETKVKDKAQSVSRCLEPMTEAEERKRLHVRTTTAPIFPWNDYLDRCWYRGQFISATGNTPTALAVKTKRQSTVWCAACQEYREQFHDHQCTRPLREPKSVSLSGVWKSVYTQHTELRELRRNPAKKNPFRFPFHLTGEFCMDDETHQLIVVERAKLIVRDYAPRVLDCKTTIDYLNEPGLRCFEKSVCSTWDIAPPRPFSSDAAYLRWCERCFPSTPVEGWYAEQCLLQLNRVGLLPELLHDGSISYFADLTAIDGAHQRSLQMGGKRVGGGASFTDDGYSNSDGKDRPKKPAYGRGDLIALAQRFDQKATHSLMTCKRCGAAFLQVRKGHDHCTDNCRKRQWEQTNTQGEN